MSKADTLLKKAASFEKLALFSDRKAFLQAIAQADPDKPVPMPPMSGANINVPFVQPPVKKPEQGIDWHYMRNMYSQTPETDPEVGQAMKQPGVHMTQDKITGRSHSQQLADTVNMFVSQMGPATTQNMRDPKREAIAKQLDGTVIAEMLRLYQSDKSGNPYIFPEIQDAVAKFGQAFASQITSCPNYAKLSQLF